MLREEIVPFNIAPSTTYILNSPLGMEEAQSTSGFLYQ